MGKKAVLKEKLLKTSMVSTKHIIKQTKHKIISLEELRHTSYLPPSPALHKLSSF